MFLSRLIVAKIFFVQNKRKTEEVNSRLTVESVFVPAIIICYFLQAFPSTVVLDFICTVYTLYGTKEPAK